MAPEQAEQMLADWYQVTRDRDHRVRSAVAAGVSKYRVNQLTRLGRSTIDRIMRADPSAPSGAAIVQPEGQNER